MKTAWLSIGAGALLAACAHPLPPLHTAHLEVVEEGGGYQPIVKVKVAGRPLDMVLDTGATQSILPAGFARRAGLSGPAVGDRFVDANGHVFTMYSLPGVPVQFEGEKEAGKIDFLMNEAQPDHFGILAPQGLVASGYALTIDLEKSELRYDTEKAALDRLRDAGRDPKEVDFHRCIIEGPFEKGHRVVPVAVNGVSTSLIIDSGATNTTLWRDNPALQSMMKSTGKVGAAGSHSSVGAILKVHDVPLRFAGTEMHTSMLVSPAVQLCGKGLLGADVLHRCAIVWGASSLWASCRE
jgi:hypothetical protein